MSTVTKLHTKDSNPGLPDSRAKLCPRPHVERMGEREGVTGTRAPRGGQKSLTVLLQPH